MCWCVDVLMCWCVDVLVCWCVDVLMCWWETFCTISGRRTASFRFGGQIWMNLFLIWWSVWLQTTVFGDFYPTHQHINTSTHQHINTSTHQHINTSTHQHINTSTHQHIDTSTHQHTNTSTHQHIITSTHHHINTSAHQPSDINTSTHHHIITSTHQHINTISPTHQQTRKKRCFISYFLINLGKLFAMDTTTGKPVWSLFLNSEVIFLVYFTKSVWVISAF